ncbi:hypothetical protein JOL79_11375 [Microbispora sp. RL4-1S]|uniref:Uncharacterized protein n=1 Tax=Microbispora oryzae TaxID=2806554 RepID=A0A941AQ72_9ACTN|nr:hypothetical protein [Microbispora oryzae]MBP2704414.1 hypothetical protein [Microbispora oryzae]
MAIEAANIAETARITRVIELTTPKWEEQRRVLDDARRLDVAVWVGRARVDKYHGEPTAEEIAGGLAVPYETVVGTPQLLTYGGASNLWECLLGNGTSTAGQSLTFFNNSNAYLGVGNNSTSSAAAATQTNLQGSSTLRKAMDSTYPQHTDATTSGAASTVFRSTFGTSDANFAWEEWGIFNASSSGRMLNRKVESLGTKSSAASWVLTCTLSLS